MLIPVDAFWRLYETGISRSSGAYLDRLGRLDSWHRERASSYWGYAICEAALRKHVNAQSSRPVESPYPEVSPSQRRQNPMTWAHLLVYAVLITQLAPPTAKFLTTHDSEGGITNNISEVCAEALNMTVIQAQVILRAPDGSSLLDTESPPSDEQLERFRPSQEAVEAVTRKLSELGFRVGESGAVGITVAGDKATFERVFETTLSQGENRQTGTPSWTAAPPVTISDDLRTWIADVVFPIAPEFMP